jgi:sugar lactone lactonase YvrE
MAENIEVIAQDNNATGEGPIWDPIQRRLLWVDIDNSLIYQHVPATGEKKVIGRGLPASAVAMNQDGRLVIAGGGGLYLWRDENNYETIAADYAGESLCLNDMIAGPGGRIYAGTMYWGPGGMEKTGKLYLIRPDRSISIVEENVRLSNGLGFSLDDRTLYYADTASRCIYAFDVNETGGLSRRRVFVDVPPDFGIPDGLTVDAEGFVWCAMWYGGQVVRYDPDGTVHRRILLPARQISSVAFGGNNLMDLYITSAAVYWPSNLAPDHFDSSACMGGSLYRIRLNVQGKYEHRADFR